MAPGSVVVVKTTGSPRTVEAIARPGRRTPGVGVVDAPGSGGPAQVADGTLTVFVGGDDADVERCRPVFDAYASHVVHFGALGAGQTVKLLNNLLFGAHVELARRGGAAERGARHRSRASSRRRCTRAAAQSYALDLVGRDGVRRHAGRRRPGGSCTRTWWSREAVAAELGASLGSLGAVTTPLLERTRPR